MNAATVAALGTSPPSPLWATVTALVTAIVALIGAIVAIFKWRSERAQWQKKFDSERLQWQKKFDSERLQWQKKFDTERAQWQKTFEKSVSDWQVQFLHDLVTRRVEAYPAVLKTLAAVRDVTEDPDHSADVRDHPERLLETAKELLEHLYGEAGLVMPMTTRNHLHSARTACLQYSKGAVSREDLVNRFFYARRELRRDIQIADSESLKTALNEITDERLAEPKSAGS